MSHPPVDKAHPLTEFQRAFVLAQYEPGSDIISARFHREERLPCPLWVEVATVNGARKRLILRMDYTEGGVEREAMILPVLKKLGLTVPTIVARPVIDPEQPEAGAMTILTILPGRDFLGWGWHATAAEIAWAIPLIIEGIEQMHAVTEQLQRDPVGQLLVRKTLNNELETIIARGGPWLAESIFRQAIERLQPIIAQIHTPLAFSSSDYNQGNFLFDSERLSGLIDFTGPCFEDPHIGMAMYWIYSWFPFDRSGIVERYLEKNKLTFAEFAPRLALRCLRTLQEQIPVQGGDVKSHPANFERDAEYRQRVIDLLNKAMHAIENGESNASDCI